MHNEATMPSTGRVLKLSGAALAIMATPIVAHAQFTPPAGVTEYRLLFVSADAFNYDGTYNADTPDGLDGGAGSTSNSDYNNFANTEAAQNTSLPSATWTAIISTPSTSAVAAVCGVTCDTTVPIYLVDGTEVATSLAALFNTGTTALLNAPDEDQFGKANWTKVWTGSNADGSADTGNEAGALSNNTTLGNSYASDSNFLTNGYPDYCNGVTACSNYDPYSDPQTSYFNDYNSIYAISDVITVPVPEPVMGSALLMGGIAVTRMFRRRRRK